MGFTSRTGLIASPRKKILRNFKKSAPDLKAITGPAPYTLKPYAGLYNPYNVGCSLLCNHPANLEAKKMLQKAKDNWGIDNRSVVFPDEVEAIRSELQQMQNNDTKKTNFVVESVPEEMFRRYTQTDSRPLTPAPTLVSAHTRASATRRCVTPDPMYTNEIKEKTLLVLDLRRSHSQETLSWYGSTQLNETPLIRVVHCATSPQNPSPNPRPLDKRRSPTNMNQASVQLQTAKLVKTKIETKSHLEVPNTNTPIPNEEDVDDQVKRRGKTKKKRERDTSRASMYRTTTDPETLVAGVNPDSVNPSARPSLVPNTVEEIESFAKTKLENFRRMSCLEIDSFLDKETLRQLRRELSVEMVEFEFNVERKYALKEALKTITGIRTNCEELRELQKSIEIPILNTEMILKLPRMFSRSSIRFELPMDSRTFIGMTPLEYLKDNVWVNNSRKLLYNNIFDLHKIEYEEEGSTQERLILGEKLTEALGLVMGRQLTQDNIKFFNGLVGWSDSDVFNFQQFCGISALCERILAKDFYKQMPDKKMDPCNEVETVDFGSLERRVANKNLDERLLKILFLIKQS